MTGGSGHWYCRASRGTNGSIWHICLPWQGHGVDRSGVGLANTAVASLAACPRSAAPLTPSCPQLPAPSLLTRSRGSLSRSQVSALSLCVLLGLAPGKRWLSQLRPPASRSADPRLYVCCGDGGTPQGLGGLALVFPVRSSSQVLDPALFLPTLWSPSAIHRLGS